MVELVIKAIIGALYVVIITLLAKTRYVFLAGLLPLFPAFALIAHYVVGTTNSTEQLRSVVLFGMFSLIPYFLYLLAVYYFHDKTNIYYAIGSGLIIWFLSSSLLVLLWTRWYVK